MRPFVLILLAIYTLILAGIPCQDEMADSHERISSISRQTEKHTPDLDLCSPFCVCACCASVTLQQQLAKVPLLNSFISFEEVTFAYLPGKINADLSSIWQPPRI